MAPHKSNFLRPSNLRSPSAREFWRGLSEERFLAPRCKVCEATFFPPRPRCPECVGEDLEWTELSGRGTLHSWTEVHIASPEFETPFLLGLVDLEDGIGRFAAKIMDARAQQLEIGMPVRISYVKPDADFTLYCVRLV